MEHLFKNIIISLAYLIGFVLLIIGIKNLNLNKNKNYSLFIITIFLILNLSNCVSSQTDKNSSEMNNKLKIDFSDKIIELNKLTEWQEFKTFWNKLDSIKPRISEYDKSETYLTFNFSDYDNNKYDMFLSELYMHVKNLQNIDLLTDTEIDFLQLISSERIEFLFKFNSLLISHMAPPKIVANKVDTSEKLEFKIDTLINLQNTGLITNEEFQSSVNIISNEIINIAISSTILTYCTERYYGSIDYSDTNTLNQNLLYLDEYFKMLKKNNLYTNEAEEKYQTTKLKIMEIENNKDKFKELIEDLLYKKTIDNFELPEELKEFKILWLKLDEIEPVKTTEYDENGNEKSILSYYESDDNAYFERENFKTELSNIVEILKNNKTLSEIEIEALRLLTYNRIEALQGPNLYTRSISTVNNTLEKAINLEFQIDTLNLLKNKKLIDSDQYNSALMNIFDLSDEIILKKYITQNFYYFDKEYSIANENITKKYLEILDFYYNELKANLKTDDYRYKEIDNKYVITKEKILEIEKILPKIHTLIKSFEE